MRKLTPDSLVSLGRQRVAGGGKQISMSWYEYWDALILMESPIYTTSMWRLMILDAYAALLHPRLADKTPDQPTSIESRGQISILSTFIQLYSWRFLCKRVRNKQCDYDNAVAKIMAASMWHINCRLSQNVRLIIADIIWAIFLDMGNMAIILSRTTIMFFILIFNFWMVQHSTTGTIDANWWSKNRNRRRKWPTRDKSDNRLSVGRNDFRTRMRVCMVVPLFVIWLILYLMPLLLDYTIHTR